jgi:hypothetical protein
MTLTWGCRKNRMIRALSARGYLARGRWARLGGNIGGGRAPEVAPLGIKDVRFSASPFIAGSAHGAPRRTWKICSITRVRRLPNKGISQSKSCSFEEFSDFGCFHSP